MSATDQQDEWTWLYRKTIKPAQQAQNAGKKDIIFSRLNVPPFNQLLFSFNAFRPQAGYFSFFVQVQDKNSNKWGIWHKMIDWGADTQRSYMSGTPGKQQYLFVRLELGQRLAQAFRIKIAPYEQADLSLMKGFSVTISDLNKFKHEGFPKYSHQLSAVHIDGVPKLSQFLVEHPSNHVLCSPTSCSMLTNFMCKTPIDVATFANNAFDHGLQQFGSWPFNMAHAFEHCTGSCYFINTRLHSFQALHAQLKRGIPVVVSVRGELSGAPQRYDSGHLLVVIGFNSKKKAVIVHDPAAKELEEVQREYPLKSFLEAWERSRRLAYLADPIV
jgi:hypothetical protein